MRLTWKRALATLAGLAVLGALVVVSGIVPVAASSDHWPPTRWFLDFAMSRSVSTHAARIEVPDLDDPALVLRGAAHYELGCSPCHGRPGQGPSEILLEMAPRPPLLTPALQLWEPAELFYIVRHGVKFTAMPAWPVAGREDEVWAMVAFLLELRGMDEARYRRLALGDARRARPDGSEFVEPDAAIPELETCARCHGWDGRGRGLGAFPALAGQSRVYLQSALEAFAGGGRPSGTMHAVAAALPLEAIHALAAYFEEQGAGDDRVLRAGSDDAGVPQAVERGRELARRGLPERKIPSCAACHGPVAYARNPAYPTLAGQYARYLVEQLHLLASERRGGTEHVHLMHTAVRALSPEEIQDVAAYYASLAEP